VKPIACASCGQPVTMAVWDTRSEQLLCVRCIPLAAPLPSGEGAGRGGAFEQRKRRLALRDTPVAEGREEKALRPSGPR
jgi:hypothetical protein